MSYTDKLLAVKQVLSGDPSLDGYNSIRESFTDGNVLNFFLKELSTKWASFLFQNHELILCPNNASRSHWPYRVLYNEFASKFPKEASASLLLIYQPSFEKESFFGTVIEVAISIVNIDKDSCLSLLQIIIDGHKRKYLGPWLSEAYKLCLSLLEGDTIVSEHELLQEIFLSERAIDILRNDHSAYFYTEFFPKVSELISEKENLKVWVQRVSQLLINVLHFEKDIKENRDYTYITRPAIEEHEHNSDINRYTSLIPVLRDACEKGLDTNNIEEVFDWLKEYKLDFFQRLRLHLARVNIETSPDKAKAFMMDKSFLTEYWVSSPMHHEYAVLCRDVYSLLEHEEKAAWIEMARNAFVEENPETPYKEHYLAMRLRWVYTSLSDDLKKESDKLTEKYRESDFDWFHSTGGLKAVVYGDAYKYEKLGLQQKSFLEALDDLIKLEPKSTWDDEDPLHPNSILKGVSSLIKENPEDVSTSEEQLLDTPVKFHDSIVEGIRQLVDQGDKDYWPGLWSICKGLISKQVKSPEESSDTLYSILWLIREAHQQKTQRQHLDLITEILLEVASFVQANPKQENVNSSDEPCDVRLNEREIDNLNETVGRWVNLTFDQLRLLRDVGKIQLDEGEAVKALTFETPKGSKSLGDALLKFAKPELEEIYPSFWAGVGYQWGNFYYWDRNLLESEFLPKVQCIDQTPVNQTAWIIWNEFIQSRPANRAYWNIKMPYEKAIEVLESDAELKEKIAKKVDSDTKPWGRLGQHLSIYYAWGLDGAFGLLKKFLDSAPMELRMDTMSFVGRSLSADNIGDDWGKYAPMIERFKILWVWYWDKYRDTDFATGVKNGGVFGKWFISGIYRDKWALERLTEVMEKVPFCEPDSLVADELQKVYSRDLGLSLKVLDLLTQKAELFEGNWWKLYHWKDAAYEILKEIIKKDDGLKEKAEEVADRFVALAPEFLHFTKLLGVKLNLEEK